MNEANKVQLKPAKPSLVVKDSLDEIKVLLLGKVLTSGDKVGSFEVHKIEPKKSKITENTEVTFKSGFE
jgi:hypothetical protein